MAYYDSSTDTTDTDWLLEYKAAHSLGICSYLFGLGATWTIKDPDFKIAFI